MTYNELSEGLQNIIWYNYESSTKFFIILLLLFVSMTYLYYIRPKFKETENPIIAVFRVIVWIISYMFLYSFPLLYVFLLAPGYEFNTLIIFLLRVYAIGFIFITLYVIFNFSVILPLQLLKQGKLSPDKFKNTLLKNLKLK
jgi:hypothetical protein